MSNDEQLGDVLDMPLLSECRNIDNAKIAFRAMLNDATTYAEVIRLYRQARDWERGFSYLTDCAAAKLEKV